MGDAGPPQREIGVVFPEYRGVDTERLEGVSIHHLLYFVTEGVERGWEGHWHPFKLCLGLQA